MQALIKQTYAMDMKALAPNRTKLIKTKRQNRFKDDQWA